MKIEDAINKLVDKCDIYYKNTCISNEPIIRDFLRFFSKSFNQFEKRVSFSLNTGSLIFDIVASVSAVVSSLGYNENTNDDIISGLNIGDMVLYKNKRYLWGGLEEEKGIVYMVLKKNKNGILKTSYEINKHLVKKYHGKSKTTDGRGIRKKKTNREDFFSYIYEIKPAEVPSAIDASFIVVADKDFGLEVLKEVFIKYNEKRVHLLDLVACSYYTNSLEEVIIGSNPSKKEPVLKLTSQISTARELALSKDGNSIAGVIVNVSSDTATDNSELKDLITRKKIRFLHYMTRYDTSFGECIVKEYTNSSIFACTPSYLKELSLTKENKHEIIRELNKQINNLADLKIEEVLASSPFSFDIIKKFRTAILAVRESNSDSELVDEFILNSFALLNLYLTAPFKLDTMEKCIEENELHIGVVSPIERINKLENLRLSLDDVGVYVGTIISFFRNEYNLLYEKNSKAEAIESLIRQNIKKRIAIVVPKAYYKVVLKSSSIFGINTSNVFIETLKGFNPDHYYDVIIVVGDMESSRFKLFECCSTSRIYVLLYEYENQIHMLKKRKATVYAENIYNKHKKYTYVIDEKLEKESIRETEDLKENEEDFGEISRYIDSLKYVMPTRYTSYSGGDSGVGISEVSYVGFFETGERIFFSKYYSAVVYDDIKGVEEKSVDKLKSGDTIVFTRNDNYTKNIVDYIFEELLEKNKLNDATKKSYEKSQRWKELLREYKENGNYSFREVTEKLNALGLDYGEVAIRQWIIPESHIVGPRKSETIRIIGELVEDYELINGVLDYDEAFKIIRKQRRKILDLISRAINDKLAGKRNASDEILQIVFDNVDRLSETFELESIQKLGEMLSLPVGMVNRPMDSEDVGI